MAPDGLLDRIDHVFHFTIRNGKFPDNLCNNLPAGPLWGMERKRGDVIKHMAMCACQAPGETCRDNPWAFAWERTDVAGLSIAWSGWCRACRPGLQSGAHSPYGRTLVAML